MHYTMNWLHFCDFHIGSPRGPQANALKSLVEKVAEICDKTGELVDAVFLVGDLSYSGQTSEYDSFRDDFYLPLMKIPGVQNARVFAVPGNHDVDCSIGVPIRWETIGERKQQVFFCEDGDGQKARQQRAEVFDAYRAFVKAHNIESPDPKSEVSKMFNTDELPITIIATNTAFFSDESENKRPKSTPAPLPSLRHVIPSGPPAKPILVIGHHSLEAFRLSDFKLLKVFLKDKKACFLHGHEHDPEVTTHPDGSVRSIGFGATYLESLESRPEGPYSNSFTYCTLTDKIYMTAFSWERGRWVDTTAIQFSDCDPAERTHFDRVSVRLPVIAGDMTQSAVLLPLSRIARAHPHPTRIIPIAAPNDRLWKRLIPMSENVRRASQEGSLSITTLPETDGKWQGILEVNDERHLLVCVPGGNHVLSAKEVETLNTRLDTEDFRSVTVISMGVFSDEARSMYLRLQTRKPIEILVNTDLTGNADRILSSEQKRHLQGLDAATTSVRLLVTEEDIFCLIVEGAPPTASFYLLDADGNLLSPTAPIVSALRKGNPEFATISYKGDPQQRLDVRPSFDEGEFLRKSYEEYNTTKYAALANIGFRFSDLPLKELYVNARAAEVMESGAGRLEAIVEDHLAKFPASDALKAHIQRQLLSALSQDAHQETSDAREFCQKYGSVLLTGDPGAGKTCFVKSEILAYCERALSGGETNSGTSWHSAHIPVMLPLSEVVSEGDFENVGLFTIASRLFERKGLPFPADHMVAMASQGRLALFFDGLDEIVSIEKRALAVRHINEFVETYLPFGNRVVVTSRPAAVHVVNLLPTLHKLELQGLSEPNIRTLAERVLSLKVVETTEGGLLLDEKRSSKTDSALVERLLRDCQQNPGVHRLAQNPLLLTLLILIYANSGAPSAKRHLIYAEAIKTLSSVRGREAGHAPISAPDLKERLGAIALSVYKKESGLLPTRGEVREQVRGVMARQRGENVSATEADEFIQKVAESTGLISIGGREDTGGDDAVVTFMHHSFLEYFAASGLSLDLASVRLEDIVHKPRWHEILTLLSGIIGDNADVAPILSKFLQASNAASDVDAKLLLFAVDCALESEVPSEAAQRLLAKAIDESIKSGAAKSDPWVRSELGRRLSSLFASCGTVEFESVLVKCIASDAADESAAAIRIVAYACADGVCASKLIAAVNAACVRNEELVSRAICWAAGHAEAFRTDATLQLIATNLKKAKRRKQAAFEAIAKIPSLAVQHWPEIINGIDDEDNGVRRAASQAAVQAGINADLVVMATSKKDVLLRALRSFDELTGDRQLFSAKVRRETLGRLLDSGDRRSRLIGIGLLPMVDQSERYIYERLIGILNEREDREEVVASLVALTYSGDVLSLLNVADLRLVQHWLATGTGDIRLAALRVLGIFGRDLPVVQGLLRFQTEGIIAEEYAAFMAALGNAKVSRDDASEAVSSELTRLLDPAIKMTSDNVRRLAACLDALRRLEQNASDGLVTKIGLLVDDYRADQTLRSKALLCLPAVAIPSASLVAKLTNFFDRRLPEFELELVQVPSILARKCRQSVDYVIASVGSLSGLREAAIRLHKKISERQTTVENEFRVTELRSGIEEVTNIMVAFDEFIDK
ncbi:MAG TPA: NACHT domain-containing protein [Chthoniobacterales bacterium]